MTRDPFADYIDWIDRTAGDNLTAGVLLILITAALPVVAVCMGLGLLLAVAL